MVNTEDIPKYNDIMLPMLKIIGDRNEHAFKDVVEKLSEEFDLTEEQLSEKLKSGAGIFYNRANWARTYLSKAGLLEYTRKRHFMITDRGSDLLKEELLHIDRKLLMRYPEFVDFQKRKKTTKEVDESTSEDKTPEELMSDGYEKLRDDLSSELLDTILSCSPDFFEKLVVELIVRMGYGGSMEDAGKAIGGSGDEGVDGIIKEDKLGLDTVYIQAKRWQNSVGRPELQKFAGALQGKRARKGIFITTSNFSKGAEEYVTNIESKIVLIDGQKLTDLMIDNNVGVSTEAAYEIKKIDSDYFEE
jgi:restriction system protein